MNTSSRFVVGVHVLALLTARRFAPPASGEMLMSSEELAESVNTNPVVIRRILSQLQQADLVITHSGRNGGSELARPPEKINLREVYEATEPGLLFHLHYSDPDPFCPVGAYIEDTLSDVFAAAREALKCELEKRTLHQVAVEVMERAGLLELVRAGATFEELRELVQEHMKNRAEGRRLAF